MTSSLDYQPKTMDTALSIEECKRWFYKTRSLPEHLRDSPGVMGEIIKCAFAKPCREYNSRTEGTIVTTYVGRNIKKLMKDLKNNIHK